MTIDQKLAVLESIRSLIATLIWPVVAIFIVIKFGPQIRQFFSDLGELSFKAAGVEATAKRRIEAAAALGAATAKAIPDGEQPAPAADARNIAALVEQRVTQRNVDRLSRARVLWVDDNPENNTHARRALEALGIIFVLSESTEDALRKLEHERFDAIISDMERGDDPIAGLALLEVLRGRGDATIFLMYTSSSTARIFKADTKAKGAQGITGSAAELFDMVSEALSSGKQSAA